MWHRYQDATSGTVHAVHTLQHEVSEVITPTIPVLITNTSAAGRHVTASTGCQLFVKLLRQLLALGHVVASTLQAICARRTGANLEAGNGHHPNPHQLLAAAWT